MKKNIIVPIIIIVLLFGVVIGSTIMFGTKVEEPSIIDKKDYSGKNFKYKFYKDRDFLVSNVPYNGYQTVISEYSDDYRSVNFDGDKQFVMIETSFNECHHSINNVTFNTDKDTFEVYIDVENHCGLCANYDYYIIKKVDKKITDVKVYTKVINQPKCNKDIDY